KLLMKTSRKFILIVSVIIPLTLFNANKVQAERLDLTSNNSKIIGIEDREKSISHEKLLEELSLSLTDEQNEIFDLILEKEDVTTQLLYEAILYHETQQLDLAIAKYNEILSNPKISEEVVEIIE